ncbi:hypothetical protein ACFL3G_09955 [Planctomycetota bacterium]
MKTKLVIIVFILIATSFANASDESPELDIIIKRLKRLQNLKVNYSSFAVFTPPQKLIDSAIKNKKKYYDTGLLISERNFSYLSGKSRHTSSIIVREPTDEIKHMVPEVIFQDISFPGNRVEEFSTNEKQQYNVGRIKKKEQRKLLTEGIEMGLGLRMWGQNKWLEPNEIKNMNIDTSDSGYLILTKVDKKGCTHEWSFKTDMKYALESYRRLIPPYSLPNIEYKMGGFKEVDGIFLPSEMTYEVKYLKDGELKIAQKHEYSIENYKINDPNNTPDSYHIKWLENTLIIDEISRVGMWCKDGMLQPEKDFYLDALDDFNDFIPKMNFDIERDSNRMKMFIPEKEFALSKNIAYVHDLSRKKLFLPKKNDNMKTVYKSLSKSGQGDIAWDKDKLLITRDAKITEDSLGPNKLILVSDTAFYQLVKIPSKIKLPVILTIKTKNERQFEVKIHSIESDGIWITTSQKNKISKKMS